MQRNEEIIRAYLGEGLPLQEIGVRFGFHRETVAKILEKAGVRKRASRTTGDLLKQRDGEIIRLYVEERLSLREIVARCGLSVSGIRSILERAGVQARSTSHLVLTREELAQRNLEIVRLHLEEGLAARQISGQLALGVERVYTVLRAAGISRRRSGHPSAGSSQQRTS
jgi:DNA-binding CsgD family transcriptional regulator